MVRNSYTDTHTHTHKHLFVRSFFARAILKQEVQVSRRGTDILRSSNINTSKYLFDSRAATLLLLLLLLLLLFPKHTTIGRRPTRAVKVCFAVFEMRCCSRD